jgi:methionyl-tRNA formyltransferase
MANGQTRTTAVVFAFHNVGVRCLSVLLDRGVAIELVVTHPDPRNETIWFESVEALARRAQVPVLLVERGDDPELARQVAAISPDLIFSFYFRQMLPPALLALARHGAYNLHGSLLPKYRGRVPINWAIIHGESQSGASLHEMVAKPDAGALVDQLAVPILINDTAADVFAKVTVAAELVMDRSLSAILARSAPRVPQQLELGSYFGARRPEDGRIDLQWPAKRIHDFIRALAPPFPGAFIEREGSGDRIQILGSYWDRSEAHRADQVSALYWHDASWWIAGGDGVSVRITRAEQSGRLLMP